MSTLRQRAEAQAAANAKHNRIPQSPAEATQLLEELRVHQIELEMQNDELRRTQEELEVARARYFDLYDLAPVGYVTLSEQGLICEANLTAATLLGVARSALVKQPFPRFMFRDDQDIYYLHRKVLFETGAPQTFDLRMVKSDGAIFWARLEVIIAQGAPIPSAGQSPAGAFVCLVTLSDITERKQAELALGESERRLREIVDNAPFGAHFYELQPGDRLVFVGANRAADSILRVDHQQFIGKTIEEEFPPLGQTGIPDAYRRAAATGERYDADQVEYADGRIRGAFEVHAFQTGPGRMAALFRDITERKQAEAARFAILADLQRSNADLEQFAYVASHDLQEPLRMVTSFVQLLAERYRGQLDADADEFIGYAVEGALRMQQLILDLLEYARVGTRGEPPQPTDATAVCLTVIQDLEVAITEAGATVVCDPLPTVLADPPQLRQLFQNLIGNAIKFRGAEPPVVHVAARLTSADLRLPISETAPPGADRQSQNENRKSAWEFAVRDNSIGMEPQFFERIFVIFQRLHARREYPGTGIGLAVCKTIVERHGGRIWVESAPGRGSTFYFTLPAVM